MKCRDCQALLQAQLDGLAAPTSPEWRLHLEECRACREDWQASRALVRGLAAPKKTSPPSQALAARVVTRILDDRRKRHWRMKLRWAAVWTLAASVLVIVGLSTFFSRREGSPEIAKTAPPAPMEAAAAPKIDESVAEARQAIASLGSRIADRTKEDARLLWSAAPTELPSVPRREWEFDPALQSLQQTGQALSEGVRPMTRSAAAALEFFSRELTSFDLFASQ